jgi:hypothetical protein
VTLLDAEPLRPGSADFPLFLHVLGAMTLFGAALATAVLAWAGAGRGRPAVARGAFWTLLAVALPAWVLMRAGGQWVYSREGYTGKHDPGWVGIGFLVADPGLLVLLVATGVAFWWSRRAGAGWQARAVAILSSLYLVALAVAWWAMAGKP